MDNLCMKMLREQTAVIVPAHLPANCAAEQGRAMLSETAASFIAALGRPEALCIAVDGTNAGAEIVEALQREMGFVVALCNGSRGKLESQRAGVRRMAGDERFRYFALADQDGDHFANELPNLLRAAAHVERTAKTERVMALGRRISRHRPMGFLRGELEELADRVLLDALQYHSSHSGKPLQLEFALTMDEYPDFHSGYKALTRPVAEAVFLSEPRTSGCDEECYYRHAVEAVISVEALLAGARLVSVNRSTIDEQPVSAFGLLDRRRMAADMIIWPCKRMNVPGEFVTQWVNNHLPRILLGTHAPAGKTELLAIRGLIFEMFGLPNPGAEIMRPEFI